MCKKFSAFTPSVPIYRKSRHEKDEKVKQQEQEEERGKEQSKRTFILFKKEQTCLWAKYWEPVVVQS